MGHQQKAADKLGHTSKRTLQRKINPQPYGMDAIESASRWQGDFAMEMNPDPERRQ